MCTYFGRCRNHLSTCTMLFVAVLAAQVFGRAPLHSWDTLSSMSFFHACNETGLWSERALDTITKFPFVTVEKGQAFHAPCPKGSNAPCAEVKIISQLKAIKDRNSSIATVFYMNSVLSWYFYHMVCACICVGIMAMSEVIPVNANYCRRLCRTQKCTSTAAGS